MNNDFLHPFEAIQLENFEFIETHRSANGRAPSEVMAGYIATLRQRRAEAMKIRNKRLLNKNY